MAQILHEYRFPLWSRGKGHAGRVVFLFVTCLAACGIGFARHVIAQSDKSPWTTPVNISKSGAASQPIVAVAPDGRLHMLWWDSAEGEQYAQTTSLTGTTWTTPTTVSQIFGERKIETNTGTGKSTLILKPPLEVRLLSTVHGNVYAFWRDADNQLFSAQTQGIAWTNAVTLTDSALTIDAVADAKGALHLAYLRPQNSPGNPSGVYYQTTSGRGDWSAPVLVYTSLYFRTTRPEQAHVSVASNGLGQVVVIWDDLEVGQSFFAHSADGGRTWNAPQMASASQAQRITRVRVASSPNGDFFLLWQDATEAGCGQSLRRSTDGGLTWSAPERIPVDINRCPGRWHFSQDADGRLWLVGLPLSTVSSASGNSVILIAWNGRGWSKAADVSLTFQDEREGKIVSLSGPDLSLSGQSVGIVGSDAEGDVWAARNAVALEALIPALQSIWDPMEKLDHQSTAAVKGVPALAADNEGRLVVLWSESPDEIEPGTSLYVAVWDRGRWSGITEVLKVSSRAKDSPNRAEQPAMAVDDENRLHVVWRGGYDDGILYSWAFAHDATLPQGWAEPIALPIPARLGSSPDIVADPRNGTLHLVYAIPYNEGRGIYYLRSNDSGATWLTPTVVFDAASAGWDSVDKPQLALDAESDVLYAIWLKPALMGGTGGNTIMYARSDDGGRTWSAPVKVVEAMVDWPRVVIPRAGQVYLIWNQAKNGAWFSLAPAEVWGQFSADGGRHWTEPTRLQGFEEVSGPVDLTPDGAGGLYMVGLGQGIGGEAALLYARWDGQTWGKREIFGLNQEPVLGNAAVVALMPKVGRLGAVLRESVRGLDGKGQFVLMATGREVEAVPAAKPAPTLAPLPTLASTPAPTPLPTATTRPSLAITGVPRAVGRNPLQGQASLMAGGALVLLVILGVAGRVIWVTRR